MLWLLACRTPPPPPDILLVVLDTVRADAVEGYGGHPQSTPHLAALAQQGVRFLDVTASGSWTWPTHAALLTGEPPWVSGAHATAVAQEVTLGERQLSVAPIHADVPTLAERLSAQGYRTVSVAANRLLSPSTGLTRGFALSVQDGEDAAVVARARQEIQQPDARPLFLFVNLMSAHSPYHVTPAFDAARLAPESAPAWIGPYLTDDPPGVDLVARSGARYNAIQRYLRGELEIPDDELALLRDLYDGEVAAADAWLGELLEAWRSTHPDGVIAVTSDHGESFGEHGMLAHGALVLPALNQVPLVLSAPDLPAGAEVAAPVQLRDLFPTLLSLAGAESERWSLLDAIARTPRPEPITAAAWPRTHLLRPVGGRFTQGWRLYREGDRAVIVGSDQGIELRGEITDPGGLKPALIDAPGGVALYDLSSDPDMLRDLAPQQPEAAAALAERARAMIPLRLDEAGGLSLSGADVEALRALGYVE